MYYHEIVVVEYHKLSVYQNFGWELRLFTVNFELSI